MILYAPIIEPSIPAFSMTTTIENGTTYWYGLKVQFQHNIAVSRDEVGGIKCLIKDANTGSVISEDGFAMTIDWASPISTAHIWFEDAAKQKMEMHIGNFYKVQIAYVDMKGKSQGPYSTVGITRYLGGSGRFNLSINGLVPGELNTNKIQYRGICNYDGNDGITEPIYQYRFSCTAEDGEIVEDSGWLLPSSDQEGKSIMEYTLKNQLEFFKNYNLTYSVLTVNGYQTSVTYQIVRDGLYPIEFNGTLVVEQPAAAKENGYVLIRLGENSKLASGAFRLIRQAEHSDTWDELTRFRMHQTDDINIFQWKDYSVEHGQKYTYALQQYGRANDDNGGAYYYSSLITDSIHAVEFDHMFLGDDKYQLKLAYNPQVSSFKETVLESKTDVIGGKYPFFFRNGNVRYKEIPISGLLSYFLDSDGFFLTTTDVTPGALDASGEFKRTTNLEHHNFATERQFKMAVLDWLNNGKPKLFRSPAEGNYVLRLMSISMSPNQQLGRMLHTVSATGYEVMDNSPATMLEQKVISFNVINSNLTSGYANYGNDAATKMVYEYRSDNLTSGLKQLCALKATNEGDVIESVGIHYLDTGNIETIKPVIMPGETKTYTFEMPVSNIALYYPSEITCEAYGVYEKT